MPRERDAVVLNEDESTAHGRLGRRRRILRRVSTHRRLILFAALGTLLLGTAWMISTWPDVEALRDRNPDSTAFIDRYMERSGRSTVAWSWVPASRISPYLKEAVVVSEDLEFFSHDGFSVHEIKEAIRKAVEEREPPRGASTITQQLAKNLWLSPSRDPLRKVREVVLTRQLERHLGKNRILELYLNVAEFGPGVYGAESAARHYFGKSAAGLTPREAAMLASALPRPRQWHPGVESASYARRVATVLVRMQQVTFLDRRFGIGGAPGPVPVEVKQPLVPIDSASLPPSTSQSLDMEPLPPVTTPRGLPEADPVEVETATPDSVPANGLETTVGP